MSNGHSEVGDEIERVMEEQQMPTKMRRKSFRDHLSRRLPQFARAWRTPAMLKARTCKADCPHNQQLFGK